MTIKMIRFVQKAKTVILMRIVGSPTHFIIKFASLASPNAVKCETAKKNNEKKMCNLSDVH